MSVDQKVQEAWERFLNPETLRQNLMLSSMFITAYEILKESIVDHIKQFFITGFDQTGWRIDPKYTSEVLARNRSPVQASLLWLQEQGAIDQSDIEGFEKVRKCRNEITHELLRLLSEGIGLERVNMFTEMVRILRKIETWWIVNVEIPTNPDFDGNEVDEKGIVPGPLITLQLIMDIALGTGKADADWYYKEFKKMAGGV